MITKTKLKVDRINRQAKNNIFKSKLKKYIYYRLLVIHQIFLFEQFFYLQFRKVHVIETYLPINFIQW